jgi:hypothetical protein
MRRIIESGVWTLMPRASCLGVEKKSGSVTLLKHVVDEPVVVVHPFLVHLPSSL